MPLTLWGPRDPADVGPMAKKKVLRGAIGRAIVVLLAAGGCADIEVTRTAPARAERGEHCPVDLFPAAAAYPVVDLASANVSCPLMRSRCIDELRKQACVVGATTVYDMTESVQAGFTHIWARLAARATPGTR